MQSIFRDAVRTAEHICGMHISLCAHWLQLHFLPIGQQARMDGPLLCDAPVLRPEAEIIRGAVSAPAKHLGQRHIGSHRKAQAAIGRLVCHDLPFIREIPRCIRSRLPECTGEQGHPQDIAITHPNRSFLPDPSRKISFIISLPSLCLQEMERNSCFFI